MADMPQKEARKKKSKNRGWVHFLLWGLMILFLFIAPGVKDRLTIKEGKPVALEPGTLAPTGTVRYAIDKFDQIKSQNQMLYRVIGWSFLESDPDQSKYIIYLVCKNARNTYYFLTTSGERADVEAAFPDFSGDLSNSGFTTLISKDTMKNGVYEVGFLYQDQMSGIFFYDATDAVLSKTMNNIQLDQ